MCADRHRAGCQHGAMASPIGPHPIAKRFGSECETAESSSTAADQLELSVAEAPDRAAAELTCGSQGRRVTIARARGGWGHRHEGKRWGHHHEGVDGHLPCGGARHESIGREPEQLGRRCRVGSVGSCWILRAVDALCHRHGHRSGLLSRWKRLQRRLGPAGRPRMRHRGRGMGRVGTKRARELHGAAGYLRDPNRRVRCSMNLVREQL